MVVNMFKELLAKSEPKESLQQHIQDGLKKVVELYSVLESQDEEITWPMWSDKGKRNLSSQLLLKLLSYMTLGK